MKYLFTRLDVNCFRWLILAKSAVIICAFFWYVSSFQGCKSSALSKVEKQNYKPEIFPELIIKRSVKFNSFLKIKDMSEFEGSGIAITSDLQSAYIAFDNFPDIIEVDVNSFISGEKISYEVFKNDSDINNIEAITVDRSNPPKFFTVSEDNSKNNTFVSFSLNSVSKKTKVEAISKIPYKKYLSKGNDRLESKKKAKKKSNSGIEGLAYLDIDSLPYFRSPGNSVGEMSSSVESNEDVPLLHFVIACEKNCAADDSNYLGRVLHVAYNPIKDSFKNLGELTFDESIRDYSDISVSGNKIALVSQESGVLVTALLYKMLDGEIVMNDINTYKFPIVGKSEFCTVEGIAWVDATHLMAVTDLASKDYSPICKERDQAVHFIELPI